MRERNMNTKAQACRWVVSVSPACLLGTARLIVLGGLLKVPENLMPAAPAWLSNPVGFVTPPT